MTNMSVLDTIDGLLVDIDGVLTIGNKVIPGAAEALASVRARGIEVRYLTNTTIYCRHTLQEHMQAMGFSMQMDHLVTPTFVAAEYLRSQGATRYLPLLLPDAQLEFPGLDVDEVNPEFVVVGDMGAGFNFPRLNMAFRALLNGAQLVALHKKRYWRTEDGLFLDAGPFVMALEYAAGVGAVVMGKPSAPTSGCWMSAAYFRRVLDDLGMAPDRVAMIGDDIEIDVRGSQQMGMQGWLVKTGRFRREDLSHGIWPDKIFESIDDLRKE